jgi:DNA-binding transcriptional LysR family regulator
MPTPDQIAALRENQLDFGLIRLPVSVSGLDIRVVLEEPFVVALPDDHALAAQTSIHPPDLRGFPAFVLARRYAPGFHDDMLVALKREGVDLNIAQELGEFSTMLALVSAGLGIGVIPAAAAMALPPKVVARPLELRDHTSGIGLASCGPENAIKRALLDVIELCTDIRKQA